MDTCGVVSRDVETYFSVAAAEFIIILVLTLAGVVSCLKNRQNTNNTLVIKKSEPAGLSSSNSAIKDSLLSEDQ